MRFTANFNLIIQACATILQVLNIVSGVVPTKYQAWIALAVALVQGVSAWAAHQVNPDGSPARIAYVKPQ